MAEYAGGFEGEVTIKLRTRMRAVSRPRGIHMEPIESVEVWRPKKRKPSAILVNDSRPKVLRDLADWIETNDDGELHALEQTMAEKVG